VYWRTDRLDLSIPLFEATLQAFEQNYGPDHPETASAAANLGVNYKDAGRIDEAIPLLERAHRANRTQRSLAWVAQPLTDAYQQAGQFDKAEPLLRASWDQAAKKHGAEHAVTLHFRGMLGWNLTRQRKFDEAAIHLRELLAIREKQTPHGWLYFNAQSLLGEALAGSKQFAAAEELLLTGHQGMQQHRSEIPAAGAKLRLRESSERLVALYTAWDKPDEATKWQAELSKLQQ
jgi:tetratricopeptide (TPR) repeat protein